MQNYQPNTNELPSVGQLVKSTFKALIVAIVILVTVILPAEYGIDPTRVGSVLGLTRMGEIKQQLAEEASEEEVVTQIDPVEVQSIEKTTPEPTSAPTAGNSDQMVVTIPSDKSIELKAVMKKGAMVEFSWKTEGGALNYDSHGEATGSNDLAQYDKGTNVTEKQGNIIAEFDGTHGWYWRNRSGNDVKLTLDVKGDFSSLKEVK